MKTNFYKTIITSAAMLAVFTLAGHAQAVKSTTNVHGTVLDDQGKTMSYATVALLKAKDSSLVKGAISNEAGVYNYAKVNPGNYIIRVNVMGYTKAYSKPFTAGADAPEITIPAIKLTSGTKTLKDVNVVSAKPLIERKIDRTVMNVENSVLAAGNSALEILEKAPGVTVDKDDNISLKGKQGVTVMIDGKLTYLSAPQLASLLRSTDGNNIQSIEIITNPSAKYDAAGNSGIINIKLKKNKTVGTNGSLSLTGAMGNYPKENGNLSLNHKDGKLNIFGSYGAGNRKRANDLFIDRVFSNTDGTKSYYSQHTFMPQTNYNNTFRLGADYDATKETP